MSEVAETTATALSEEILRSQQPGELQNIRAAYRLNGKNYLKWSQVLTHLYAKVLMVVFEVLAHLDKRMRSLIGNRDKASGTCSLAYSGAFPTSIGLNVSSETFSNSWVMDSRATDHMTNSPNGFFHIFTMPKQ
jgi:hypothetical protein